LFLSLLHLERLKRDALPLPVEYRARLMRWNAAAKGARAVRLCNSDEIEIPIAVGLFDAMILVPGRLLDELEPHDVDSIVLHELAHLRRADDWLNALERVAVALLFFNPAIRWLAAQLDLEREVACDDWVLQQNDALPYATCLAKVVEATSWPYRAMSAPGAFVTRRGMSIRIERLLSKQRDVRVRTSFGPAGAAVTVLAGLGIIAALVSPSIAYDVTQSSPASEVAKRGAPLSPSAVRPAPPLRGNNGKRFSALAQAASPENLVTQSKPPESAAAQANLPANTVAQAKPPDNQLAQAVPPQAPAVGAPPAVPAASPEPQPSASAGIVAPNAGVHPKANPHPHPFAAASSDGERAQATVQRAAAAAQREAERAQTTAQRTAEEAQRRADRANAEAERASARAEEIADANDPDYIDELAAAGYTGLSVDQLVQLKAVGVDADFIHALRHEGLTHLSVADLVKMRAAGVDPEFVAAMRKRFGSSLPVDEIAGLKAVGASNGYIDALSELGMRSLSADEVRELRALDVSPKYVRELRDAGYPNLSAAEIRELKALDIDREFIRRATAHGFRNLSVGQLVKLKATGVL
jgi:cell division septum initiation protein DivIVA